MKMMRLIAVLTGFALLAACNGFTLVKPQEEVKIGSAFTMTTGMEWNRLNASGEDIWTLDGVGLQMMYVKANIGDGEKISGNEKSPVFKKGMNSLELLELLKSDLVATQHHNVTVLESSPAKVGDYDGFVTEMAFEDDDGLAYKVLFKGFVRDDKLQLVRYTGLTDYYYMRGREDVAEMMKSMKPL